MDKNFIKNYGGRDYYFPCSKKKDLAADCVARAIAIALDMDWLYVMKELFAHGLMLGRMPNEPKTYASFLKMHGWVQKKTLKDKNGKKIRLRNWPLTKGNFIIHTTNHVTAMVDGVVNDNWDCSSWCANIYYCKEEVND